MKIRKEGVGKKRGQVDILKIIIILIMLACSVLNLLSFYKQKQKKYFKPTAFLIFLHV